MVALVERMLALHQKLAAATIPADKDEPPVRLYQRQTWRELAERLRPPTGRLTRDRASGRRRALALLA